MPVGYEDVTNIGGIRAISSELSHYGRGRVDQDIIVNRKTCMEPTIGRKSIPSSDESDAGHDPPSRPIRLTASIDLMYPFTSDFDKGPSPNLICRRGRRYG